MDNNYNPSSPYNPYPYGYHPNSAPYPPPANYPQYPPPNSSPYPPPSNYPQYPPPNSAQYSPYPYQSPPPPHSAPPGYGYPPQQPFPGVPPPYQYPQGYGYQSPPPHHQESSAPPLPPAEIQSNYHQYYPESGSGGPTPSYGVSGSNASSNRPSLSDDGYSSSSSTPLYPHLDYQFGNLSVSENLPSAPASPPAPAASTAAALPPSAPNYQSVSAKYENTNSFFGPSPGYGGSLSHSGSLDLSQQPNFGHAPSFIDPNNNQQYQMVPLTPSKKALKVLLLHGNLDIWIHEAKNLPNMDMFHKTMGEVFNRLPGSKNKITSDPYVSIAVTTAVIGRTYVISNSENPVWKQHFNVPVAHHAAEVHFLVKDSDVVGSQLIGIVAIPVEQIYSGNRVEGFYPLIGTNGKPCKNGAGLGLTIQYFSMEKLRLYHNGVGSDPQFFAVPGTYFPLRQGGKVTLYQDARVHDGSLPDFKLDQGAHYVHGSCWNDIFDAISKARHLIYITGWSVWHQVKLVRRANKPEYSLGELLKLKSQEGVRVLLLVWDDPTSRKILGYKIDGLMATHDEETRQFFKHSSVQVLLVTRMAGKRLSWMKKQEVGAIYTHHQKTVIVDTDAGNGKKRIIAFVGGLDLCDGRYDSPQHPLFRTLQTVHADDFHNPTFTTNLTGCPREPWHDMHSKIDGPAAYDVLTNFEERWLKASKPHGLKKLKTSYDDALLRIERVPELLGINELPYVNDHDPEGWHVQIFRSIDSNSVKGFPKDPIEATTKNLVCGKNVMIDMSIHSAYVKAIRSAQHFIYIENQYFIGSSYNWSSYKDVGANNLIPMEIALKIASKIRAHERFAVYVVIPMWPEGVPTGSATQRILFWQNKTMTMMYETIHKALVEVGLEGAFSPQDYLNFFCLGNREDTVPQVNIAVESPGTGNSPQGLARKNRRFMIYVHSKGMIVDDEYVIIGSANINQRSMEGTRDTEIAMGAYQPNHTWGTKLSSPRGQVYGYRMSLWAEHLGLVDDRFTQPESIECVRHVRALSEANWKQFAADEVTEMRGHLLKYPVEVDQKGKVKSLPGHVNFPDVGGQIIGSFLGIQENLTI
ncbi:phospholipase D gamma 1-like [Rutidosis leptorrhynchoides]|uniref:phospholipase D gamma 1-like n=1 Tax=Rutidosis leptorrhynchoides TaxID=125765 RepID=UPI003A98D7BB